MHSLLTPYSLSRSYNRIKRILPIPFTIIFFAPVLSSLAQTSKLQALIDSADVPGLQLSYYNGSVVKNYSVGLSNVSSDTKVSDHTLFQAASLSKPILGYITLRLCDKGIIDLDSPLLSYFKYLPLQSTKDANLITARMILCHASGIPPYPSNNIKLEFTPGTDWYYSAEGYKFLQKTIEHLTGKIYEQIAEEEVFVPLKMRRSSFVKPPNYTLLTASFYNQIGEEHATFQPSNEASAAYSLITTAEDYQKFLWALMFTGGLKKSTYDQMITEWFPNRTYNPDPKIGWGLGVALEKGEAETALWHWGDNGSARSFFIIYPKEKKCLVYFSNSENGLQITEDVLKLFFGNRSYESVAWNGYGKWNDPIWQARLSMFKSFLLKDTGTAMKTYRNIMQRDSDLLVTGATLNRLCFELENRKKYNLIIQLLNEHLVNHTSNIELWKRLAEAYQSINDYASAEKASRGLL